MITSTQGYNIQPVDVLRRYWGYQHFRPLQEDVIRSVLAGSDTLALMPTGGGKSLCYQVPAMMSEGLCLVISPLIALMKDQVENLRRRNITAFAIYSGLTRKEVIQTLRTVAESNCKFLYVSPERLETNLFKEYLPALGVTLVAVDEAHCISQWGYDFRPPYLRIADLRNELLNVPLLALTASATPEVQNDICERLAFKELNIFRQSFERPNLSYSASLVDAKTHRIIDIVKKTAGSGIIYCKSRRRTKEIADLLKLSKISTDFYHAGLKQEERNRKQEAWVRNELRVIVCTNAFGMGIDKPDVRFVIHADAPDCLENYYQEAGRAGRDGKDSHAILLCARNDAKDLEQIITRRFPSLHDIKLVYQAVANFLQLPSNSSEGNYYDFDFPDFIKRFKLDSNTAFYSLKALEQDGWLSLNDQVFSPPTIRFSTDKTYLHQFEIDQPLIEPIIKTLLRTYEGIFDIPVAVSENLIARLLRKDKAAVTQQLLSLRTFGIIEYHPQKDKPQLTFLRPRVRVEDLTIDMSALLRRKETFSRRVTNMVNYIENKTDCRSQIIGAYFGDQNVRQCGVCDNCKKEKAIDFNRKDFESISSSILNTIRNEPQQFNIISERLNQIPRDKLLKAMEILQTEGKIDIDKSGKMQIK